MTHNEILKNSVGSIFMAGSISCIQRVQLVSLKQIRVVEGVRDFHATALGNGPKHT